MIDNPNPMPRTKKTEDGQLDQSYRLGFLLRILVYVQIAFVGGWNVNFLPINVEAKLYYSPLTVLA